jgi:hypothetical protein
MAPDTLLRSAVDDSRPAAAGTALHVLFIESDALFFQFSTVALQAEFPGARFTGVHSASDFDRALDAGGFDMVVANYPSSWADGDSLLASIKRRRPDCPIVLFTATGEETSTIRSLRDAGDGPGPAPQFLVPLLAAVRAGLEKADLQRQRRIVEDALRISERRLVSVFDSATDAIVLADPEGRVLSWNRAARRIFGYEDDEVVGEPLSMLMPERYRARHEAGMARHRRTGEGTVIGRTVELHGLRKGGEEFPIELSISTWETEQGPCYSGMIRDITDRKRAEETLRRSNEQLRALSAHVESVREEERTAISREIHDALGQLLTVLRLDIAWLRNRLLQGKKVDRLRLIDRLRAMSAEVDQAIAQMRRISAALRPSLLDELGLRAAMEWQAQEFQRATNIRCAVRSQLEDDPADSNATTALFRIYQECLTNVARHARARCVETTLSRAADRIVLEVRDDGRGIRDPEISSPTSLGILGMRERARTLGGEIAIGPANPGNGTIVRVTVPCTAPASPGTAL